MSGAAPGTGRGPLALLPPALIVGGVLANVVGPQPYTGLPLLAAAPLAACIVLTFRGAVVIAALSVIASVAVDLGLARPAAALLVDVADVLVISLIGLWLKRVMDSRDRTLTLTCANWRGGWTRRRNGPRARRGRVSARSSPRRCSRRSRPTATG
ncbi:hypothetical protein AB0948_01295 [Streptomyces koyangensis]|uniref:hypothetical protein n=1 Tax=Streptomyces koyangensis TaxID=188770 RepID=UPI0034532FAC